MMLPIRYLPPDPRSPGAQPRSFHSCHAPGREGLRIASAFHLQIRSSFLQGHRHRRGSGKRDVVHVIAADLEQDRVIGPIRLPVIQAAGDIRGLRVLQTASREGEGQGPAQNILIGCYVPDGPRDAAARGERGIDAGGSGSLLKAGDVITETEAPVDIMELLSALNRAAAVR
ncbi:MAG: hypothetical protein HGB17_16270 [Syntrophobacteraceae bacterium]|nr:hypothetical protein [Syntrophobacteraceae bacterium]